MHADAGTTGCAASCSTVSQVSILNNTVKDIEQGTSGIGGLSGCQEGNGIDVRNTAGSTPKPNVVI